MSTLIVSVFIYNYHNKIEADYYNIFGLICGGLAVFTFSSNVYYFST